LQLAAEAIRVGSIDATVSQYPYVMGQMAVEACVAANARRAMATFPHPFRPYSDPFKRILKRR
jgi:ABC-type sugar transport system substrate-binding protein